MGKSYSNPCIRCGKERIVVKTWKEKLGNSIIINTKMNCPDSDCQEKLELDFKKQEDRRQAIKLKNEERTASRKAFRVSKKVTKVFYNLN